jgi:hypothetical protein
MSDLGAIGISNIRPGAPSGDGIELIHLQRPLDRIFGHLGYCIDDVVDNPIAKHAVLGYFKLSLQVQRGCEIVDLERQWNPL